MITYIIICNIITSSLGLITTISVTKQVVPMCMQRKYHICAHRIIHVHVRVYMRMCALEYAQALLRFFRTAIHALTHTAPA